MNAIEYANDLISLSRRHSTLMDKVIEYDKRIIPQRFDIRVYCAWEEDRDRKIGPWTVAAPCSWRMTKDEPGLIVGWKTLDDEWDNVLVWYEKIKRWAIVPMSIVDKDMSMAEWIMSEPWRYRDNPNLDMKQLIRFMSRDCLENKLYNINYF